MFNLRMFSDWVIHNQYVEISVLICAKYNACIILLPVVQVPLPSEINTKPHPRPQKQVPKKEQPKKGDQGKKEQPKKDEKKKKKEEPRAKGTAEEKGKGQ